MEIQKLHEPTDDFARRIGKIIDAEIGWEDDRRVFGFKIDFEFEATHQSTGWIGFPPERVPQFLDAILTAAGVSKWNQLRGKMVFTLHQADGGTATGFIRGLEALMDARRCVFEDWWPET
jgi:hypothetical protein